MVKLTIGLWVFVCLWTSASVAQPDNLDDVYAARAVVTGKDDMTSPNKRTLPKTVVAEDFAERREAQSRAPLFLNSLRKFVALDTSARRQTRRGQMPAS
jgi:hypothetical protein